MRNGRDDTVAPASDGAHEERGLESFGDPRTWQLLRSFASGRPGAFRSRPCHFRRAVRFAKKLFSTSERQMHIMTSLLA